MLQRHKEMSVELFIFFFLAVEKRTLESSCCSFGKKKVFFKFLCQQLFAVKVFTLKGDCLCNIFRSAISTSIIKHILKTHKQDWFSTVHMES